MATLALKSKNQILSSMVSKLLTETGINDINPGSVIMTLLELAATEDFQQYFQMLNIIRNYNLDTTTGADLDTRVFELGLVRLLARAATGKINILRDPSFVKVSTSLYSGLPNPVAGDTVIRVNDASNVLYGSSGTLIVGRGTPNEEQVNYSSPPVNFINYWQFTVTSLSNDHSLNETVILKQGLDQLISAGTQIVVPATSNSPAVNFTTNIDVTLQSGEAEVDAVEVTSTNVGSSGNIPILAINGTSAFTNPPFPGARGENLAKFTTGRDIETDDQLRDRWKNTIQTLSRGTKLAILNAIIGLLDEETAKRVVSSNIITPVDLTEPVKVYIDDGTGFEASFDEQGLEIVLAQASGQEQRLQLDLFPLVKAQAETEQAEPYDLSAGVLTLSYQVGIQAETIQFQPDDFEFANAATAEEVVAVINDRSSLIEARTAAVGTKIVISAKADENEDLQVTGGTANPTLLFPTDARSTLFLYKNDRLLSKDGVTAFVDSGSETYNFTGLGAPPWALLVTVDGKTANVQTVNFVNGDFIVPGAATAEEVALAINARLAGATASVVANGTKVRLNSNTPLSSKSKIRVNGGAANGVLGFSTIEVAGSDKDYILNRETGQIKLFTSLSLNDSITAGSIYTRAYLRTASAELYSISSGQTLVVSIDGGSNQVITFGSTGSFSAQQIADLINATLSAGTATVRVVGGLNYLEVRTNDFRESSGSIRIDSSSTAAGLNFTYNTTVLNERPHQAFVTAAGTSPYSFVDGDNLVIIVDNDPASKTFNVFLSYAGQVTSSTGATQFAALAFNVPFPVNSVLNGFKVIFKTGANTTTGNVSDVTFVSGSTYRYSFATLPLSLAQFSIGDQFSVSGLSNVANNGNFLITAINTVGSGYVEVTNANAVVETLTAGSAILGERRTINAYTGSTGAITLSSPLTFAPGIGDQFVILPDTTANVGYFFNNPKVTTLSTQAVSEIVGLSGANHLQISSKANGSDGYIQVAGGSANAEFMFSTTQVQGLQGYANYTGLLKDVHKTIYGDDTDLDTFPGVGAAGITFQVLAPTVKEVAVQANVTLAQGVSISNVSDDIKNAISGYINGLGIGAEVVVAEIIDQIMNVSNVIDVVVVTPAANINIAGDEIARTRGSLIIVS